MHTNPALLRLWLSLVAVLMATGDGTLALRSRLTAMPADEQLRALFAGNDSAAARFRPDNQGGLLQPLLRPRAPGTDGNRQVRAFIRDFFTRLGGSWRVDEDVAADIPVPDDVPGLADGRRTFTNLVATWDPLAPRFLTLAAHLDSKWPTGDGLLTGDFVAATDSAGPMAVLLAIAAGLTPILQRASPAPLISLQMVFFDGEEAFRRDWVDPDNTYGSRHLAERWAAEASGPQRPNQPPLWPVDTRLKQMDVLVLLDLLGAVEPWPRVPSYFDDTRPLHQFAVQIEAKLLALGLLSPVRQQSGQFYFDSTQKSSGISDDHLPFIQRGVSCLHIIPTPFPRVWHTMADDAQAIEPETLLDFSRILQVFVLKYLDIM